MLLTDRAERTDWELGTESNGGRALLAAVLPLVPEGSCDGGGVDPKSLEDSAGGGISDPDPRF